MILKNIHLIFLFTIVFASCKQQPSPSVTASEKNFPVIQVSMAPVLLKDMQDTVSIYGKIALRQEAFLASQFDGRLTGFSLLLGDHVKAGEKLGSIVPPMREALLQIMNQIDESQQASIRQQIREIPLTSPITGVVLAVNQHNGDVVQQGETIVHIGQLGTLDILADLPLAWLRKVRTLKRFTVTFINYPHTAMKLPVGVIGGVVDEQKQTIPLRITLQNPEGEFRPGMMVRLSFPGELHHNSCVIPRSALLEEEGVYSVFVLKPEQKVEKRNVVPGIFHDNEVEIVTGLQEGEKVITEKAYSLTDGMEVRVR